MGIISRETAVLLSLNRMGVIYWPFLTRQNVKKQTWTRQNVTKVKCYQGKMYLRQKCYQGKRFPRQNVTKAKCYHGKRFPRQNVTKAKCYQGKRFPRQNVPKAKCMGKILKGQMLLSQLYKQFNVTYNNCLLLYL